MRALLGTSALACLLAVSACGLGVKYPEFGQAAYRLEGTATPPEGGAPVSTVIYRDGAKMRVETLLPGRGPATIVFDDATKAAYIITAAAVPAAAPAPATTGPAAPAAPAAAPAPSATTSSTTTTTTTAPQPGAPANISPPAVPAAAPAPAPTVAAAAPAPQAVGVAVRINDEDAPTPLEDAWAALGEKGAKTVGSCEAAGEKGRAWTPRKQETAATPRVACITNDGIILQIREGNAVLWQATKVDRGPQAATLFGIPAGYSVVDPQAVAETVGDTMNKLDSVAGEAKTPVTATKPPG